MGKIDIDLETLYEKTGSIYKLVVTAARRATELNVGAAQLTQDQKDNVIVAALQEISEGKVSFKPRKS
ncbi:MAG: DNA-directed RNA polymerase subunit omega [Dehalococcoidia bacterium]|nr:MAG: DNA-directed RNA polymerase subunit omega [Dehalococcoidia bacterium]